MQAFLDRAVQGPMIKDNFARKFILIWLAFIGFLVLCMIALGGVTRLTESGLSMVNWHPVTGWLPPLTEADWVAEFNKYRAFPEYQLINRGMSLTDFKFIYAFEYAHRVFGRLIGLSFALPLIFIMLKGWVRKDLKIRLVVLLILGGFQGLIGWWMVKSGLVDRPDVSHYRLATHLGMALIIICYIYWIWLSVYKRIEAFHYNLYHLAPVLVIAVFAQILTGAFVAGLSAGETYNTWPLMDGQLIPDHYWLYEPVWRAPFEHVSAIQFNHRTGAYLLTGLFMYAAYRIWHTPAKKWGKLLTGAVLGQTVLGILTLVLVVPVSLGALHQMGAVFVLLVTVGYWHFVVYGDLDSLKQV